MNPLGLTLRRAVVATGCVMLTTTGLANALRLDENSKPERAPFSAEEIAAAQSMTDLASAAGGQDLSVLLKNSITSLAMNDPEAADRAMEKIASLTAGALKGSGWDLSRATAAGMNFPSTLIQTVAMLRPSPATLGLSWRFFAHRADGQFAPPAWPRMQGWQQVMLGTFSNAHGWEKPTDGTNAMLGGMTKMIGTDPPALFWMGSTALAMEIDPWEQQVLVHEAWKKCRVGDPDVEAARIMRASMQLQGHRFRRDIPMESNPVWERYSCGLVKVLRDLVTTGYAGPPACLANPKDGAAAAPPPVPAPKCQFAVAASITRELTPLTDAVIVDTGIEAGCLALESGQPTDETGWATLLRAFNTLPNNETWQTLARRYLAAFQRPNNKAYPQYETIIRSLDVAARLGDRELLESITKRFPNHAKLTRHFVMLVRGGHLGLAEAWLRRNVDTFSYRASSDIAWRPSDSEAVETLCATLKEPELQMLARLLMAANAPEDENLPRERRDQHAPRSVDILKKLAREFAASDYTDKLDRTLCLRLFAESPEASEKIADAVAESATHHPLHMDDAGQSDVVGDRLAVRAAYVRNEAARGNLEPLRGLMAEIQEASPLPAKRWQYDSAVIEVLGRLGSGATAFTPFASPASLERWRDALQEAFTLENSEMTSATKATALCDLLMLHALTGTMDKFVEWRAKLPAEKQSGYARCLQSYHAHLVMAIATMLRSNDDDLLPKAQRIQLLVKLVNDPWIGASTSIIPDLFHQFCGARVFSNRELLEAVPLLLKECPRGGRTARELASMAFQWNQRAKVEDLLAAARAAATDPALLARYALDVDTFGILGGSPKPAATPTTTATPNPARVRLNPHDPPPGDNCYKLDGNLLILGAVGSFGEFIPSEPRTTIDISHGLPISMHHPFYRASDQAAP